MFRTFDDSRMCPSREPLLGSLQDALAEDLEASAAIQELLARFDEVALQHDLVYIAPAPVFSRLK